MQTVIYGHWTLSDNKVYLYLILMLHATKLLLIVIKDRNEAIFERELSKGQTGFRSGLGTREGFFNIRAVLEKMIAINLHISSL